MKGSVRKSSVLLVMLVMLVFAGAASTKEPDTGNDSGDEGGLALDKVPEFLKELENAGFTV